MDSTKTADSGDGALPMDTLAPREVSTDDAPMPPDTSDHPSLEDECDQWETQHPAWLWCDDFEDGRTLREKYDDIGTTGMSVSTHDALSGTHALEQHYDAGQVDAGWIARYFGDTLGGDHGPIQRELYMRWWHKYEAGFQGPLPPKMARITSIASGWDKRMGVYYWLKGYEVVADVKAPQSSDANSAGWLAVQHSGFFYDNLNRIGQWVCHEMRVKQNAPGQRDGAYEFWIDGDKVIERTGVDLVGDSDWHFNHAMLDAYWNGGSPRAQNLYYDNFVISTERIGCGGS